MNDMLSAFRAEATARLAELDRLIKANNAAIVDIQEARRALRSERDELQRTLAGSVKRTRRARPVGP